MSRDTSKYALSSAQARRNSAKSPWRTQQACETPNARRWREKFDRQDRERRQVIPEGYDA